MSRSDAQIERLERRVLFTAALTSGSITEFALPLDPVHPNEYDPARMAAGADGNLWFGGAGPPFTVFRMTPSGAMTQFPIPNTPQGLSQNSYGAFTAGPDGNVWFSNATAIGRVTPGGAITMFYLPMASGNAMIEGITSGADGNLWFTEYNGNRIGRITPAGGITEFGIPTAAAQPTNIAAGPDGNVWFAERAGNKIGRITTGGVITEFPATVASPDGITAGPDGNIWFASQHAVGKMNTAGQVTLFPIRSDETTAATITPGPDGALWFLPYGGNNPIGRITTRGALTLFPVPTPNALIGRAGITAGSDGNIWFVEGAAKQIGRLDLHRTGPASIVGRNLFYNNSAFDGNSTAINAVDDGAIATDKHPLFPGQTATLANYTSYSKGINGIMIDVQGLTPGMQLGRSALGLKVGNDNNPGAWADAPAPSAILVRPGAGVGGSDRIEITWNDLAIQKKWLQVTVRGDALNLAQDDVFYFGNAVGDSGNSTANTFVNATDELAARNDPHNLVTNPAPITNLHDYNRDKKVDATDQIIARSNGTNFTSALKLITVPVTTAAPVLAAQPLRLSPTVLAAEPAADSGKSPTSRKSIGASLLATADAGVFE